MKYRGADSTSGATEEVIRVSTISLVPVFGLNRFAPLNSSYVFVGSLNASMLCAGKNLNTETGEWASISAISD